MLFPHHQRTTVFTRRIPFASQTFAMLNRISGDFSLIQESEFDYAVLDCADRAHVFVNLSLELCSIISLKNVVTCICADR